ncbi:MAG: hypothetical protein ACK4ND_03840 [Cytophagaceae bacterium]
MKDFLIERPKSREEDYSDFFGEVDLDPYAMTTDPINEDLESAEYAVSVEAFLENPSNFEVITDAEGLEEEFSSSVGPEATQASPAQEPDKKTKPAGKKNTPSLEDLEKEYAKELEKRARKEFYEFRKMMQRLKVPKFQSREINVLLNHIEKTRKKKGFEYGTAEFVALVKGHFPKASLAVIIQKERLEPKASSIQEEIISEPEVPTNETPGTDQEGATASPENITGEETTDSQTPETEPAPSPAKTKAEAEATKEKSSTEEGGLQAEGEQGETGGEANGGAKAKALTDKSSSDAYAQSLGQLPPTQFVEEAFNINEAAQEINQKETDGLKDSLPEIEQPTGLPVKEQPEENVGKEAYTPEGEVPENKPEGASEVAKAPEEHEIGSEKPALPPTPTPKPSTEGEETEDSGEALKVKQTIQQLPSTDPNLNTEFGEKPELSLEGQADPAQNEHFKEESDQETLEEKAKADAELSKEFGENEVYPEIETEMLKVDMELSEPEIPGEVELEELGDISGDVREAFDEQALQTLEADRQVEIEKAMEAKADMEASMEEERALTDERIAEETEAAREKQEEEQAKARSEVDKNRQEWQAENEAVMEEYRTDSEKERERVQGEITEEVDSANQQIDTQIADAEHQVSSEQERANREAKEERNRAERKETGFWGKLTNAVTSFFDAIKSALNTIFDALRAIVKSIIEMAKKAINAVIDSVRNLVIGLIKAFGELLKALVSIALAAFPTLRDRFLAAIDAVIQIACDVVNAIAEGLKNLVNTLLDALGAALDFILAAYQKMYNMILEALEFIAAGMINILNGIANLVKAAGDMKGNFWGQLSEELLGMDVTQPLPNERPAPGAEAAIAESMVESGEISSSEMEIAERSTLSESDVSVEPVPDDFELEPELMAQLSELPDGGSYEMETGEGSPEEVDRLRQEALTGESSEPESDSSGAEMGELTPQTEVGEEQEMVGPFAGPGERLSHLAGEMRKGITAWWNDNKVVIITAVVAVVLGLILANLLTGGAIMAALPLLLQIVGVFFTGLSLVNAAKYFGKYLGQSFPGNIIEGAVALARAVAILAVELVFSLLFGFKGALKGAKSVAKHGVKGAAKSGAKAAKASVVNTAKTSGQKLAGSVAGRASRATFRNGKMVLSGVRKGAGRGAKNLGALAKKLASRLKLKKIKIERRRMRFFIFGQFNPWVLLASGEIREVNIKRGDTIGTHGRFKLKNSDGMVDGTIVGRNTKKSKRVLELDNLSTEARKVKFREKLPDGIEVNPKGVYGYTSRNNSRYAKSDFSNVEMVTRNRNIRLEYLKQTKELESAISLMRTQKKSPEQIAKHVVEQRNLQKISARKHMLPDEIKNLEAGNLKRYNNPVGPSPEDLFKKYGDWETVIQKSMQKDPEINLLLGIKTKLF